jgi:3-mercaptopyruvate sulfurtransferase SseA
MRSIFSIVAISAVGILLLSACNSSDKQGANQSAVATASPSIAADGVRRITVPELQDLLAKNQAVVIDVRNADAYKTAHIKGAKLIPVAETLNHVNELPKDKLIVTYCS